MDNDLILRKEKLGFSGILKESFKLPAQTPKSFFFISLTSLPVFLSLLLFETLLQQTVSAAIKLPPFTDASESSSIHCVGNACYRSLLVYNNMPPFTMIRRFMSDLSPFFFSLCLVYSVLVHPFDLLNTIFIVHHSSETYSSRPPPQKLGEFWSSCVEKVGFLGPLVTSLYALLLSGLVFLGLVSLSLNLLPFFLRYSSEIVSKIVFLIIFGVLFVALLMKYMEWSSIWNMGIVISVLEAKHGVIGIGVSAYYSRGCRQLGFLLNVVFFLWRLSLRLFCLYLVIGKGWSGIGWTVAQVLCVCLGNVVKWVVFMVYFCDCKKRFLEKKVDLEDVGRVRK